MVKDRGDQKSGKQKLFKFPHSRVAYALVGLVLLAVLLVFFLVYKGGEIVGSKVVLKVGEVTVYQDQYDKYIESTDSLGVDEDLARQQLIDYHKNKTILDSMGIPYPDEFIEAQWPLVLGQVSDDYLSSVEHQDKFDTPAGRVYAFNNYVDVLSVNAEGKMYVGSLYNFPYTAKTADSELDYAERAQRSAVQMGGSFQDDVDYMERFLSDIPSTSSSHTGLYLIRGDGSASLMGGSFGLRTGLIPSDMVEAVEGQEMPYVSGVYHLEGLAYYVIRVLDSFELQGDLVQTLNDEGRKIKVIEYDR